MRRRRAALVLVIGVGVLMYLGSLLPAALEQTFSEPGVVQESPKDDPAQAPSAVLEALATLPIKGRAPKTGYARAEFGDGWATVQGCSVRQSILHRDLRDVVLHDTCTVASGVLDDPYTGATIQFTKDQSAAVQIDHVVALSDAWQKGAQNLTKQQRIALANDPLELLAADGAANQQKSDSDAASWLPKNKAFRCTYVARQIAVKIKYGLWITQAEYDAMKNVLATCPAEKMPQK